MAATSTFTFPEHAVAFWNIGGSISVDKEPRGVSTERRIGPDRDWVRFIQEDVVPFCDKWGARRVWFHNPHGLDAGAPMMFDQRRRALEDNLPYLVAGFGDALDLLRAHAIEPIAYYGGAQTFRPAWQFPDDATPTWRWVYEAIREIPEALDRCTRIGFDAVSTVRDRDDRSLAVLKVISALGYTPIIEAIPRLSDLHLLAWDRCMMHEFYESFNDDSDRAWDSHRDTYYILPDRVREGGARRARPVTWPEIESIVRTRLQRRPDGQKPWIPVYRFNVVERAEKEGRITPGTPADGGLPAAGSPAAIATLVDRMTHGEGGAG